MTEHKLTIDEPFCPNCGNNIDPELCWCGDWIDSHDPMECGHSFVPLGCMCGHRRDYAKDIADIEKFVSLSKETNESTLAYFAIKSIEEELKLLQSSTIKQASIIRQLMKRYNHKTEGEKSSSAE